MKKHFASIFIILLIGSWLISALLNSGWHTSHDGVYHILRTEEALKMLKLGEFPLRWAGNLDQGFGIPLFNFIYPLPYYFSALLSLFVSSIWAVKTVMIGSYLLGGVGMYFLFRSRGKILAVLFSLIYLMTPYQFLNMFVRGALGEILAMGLIPWVLLSFNDLKNKSKLSWYHPVPLGFLLVSHNFLGILFSLYVIGSILFVSKNRKQQITSFLISLGLSSFFLLPMIMEKGLLYSLEMQTFTFRFDQHFIYLKQFLYGKWDYWYSLPGPVDGMSFQLGISQIILSILGIGSILSFKKNHTYPKIYLAIAYISCIFLMSNRSFFVWDNIKILQTIQFPWRFLFMTTILSPLLGDQFIQLFKSYKLKVILLLILTILSFWNIRNYRRPMKQLTEAEYTDLYRLNLNKTTTTFRTEILPRWGVEGERYKTDEVLVNSGNMIIEDITSSPLSLNIRINNKKDASEGKITILRNYYPAWVATVDNNKKIELTPSQDGMIYLLPEYGIHTYKIEVKSTPLEIFANLLSLGSVLSLIYLWRKNINQ